MRRFLICIALSVAPLLLFPAWLRAQSIAAAAQNPLAGSRVFGSKGCSNCHSINGVGGKVGPDLARVRENRSFNDLAAAMWNHIPQMTEEAKKRGVTFPSLSASEAGDLIAFLFSENYFADGGNAESGKKLFTAKNCILCHQIGGVGGVLGPSLDGVAQSLSAIDIAAAMWNHGPEMAETMAKQGIHRPTLGASELRDLIAYFKSVQPKGLPSQASVIPGRVNEGRALFGEKECIKCHNVQGSGGKIAPDLGKRGLFRDLYEFAAAMWNKAPTMVRQMKLRKVAVPSLASGEMADILAYLRSFEYFGTPGNAARGRQLLADKQCMKCHSSVTDFQNKGLDSPAAVVATLWKHGGETMKLFQERNVPWPRLSADEMTHLMAFFEQTTRSKR
ncbi:MAG: c-type cytochrome [Alphaproteobacteria bacterium]